MDENKGINYKNSTTREEFIKLLIGEVVDTNFPITKNLIDNYKILETSDKLMNIPTTCRRTLLLCYMHSKLRS